MATAPFALGQHSCLKLGKHRIWADGGLIWTENEDTGATNTMGVREALYRAKAISDMLGNTLQRGKMKECINDRVFLQTRDFLDRLIPVIKQAQEQGTPEDLPAARDNLRRLPTTFVMPEMPL